MKKAFTPSPISAAALVPFGREAGPGASPAGVIPTPSRTLAGGFTLIEFLLTLVIISIVTTIALASFRLGGRRIRLELEAQKVASDIRRAQTLAAGTKTFAGVRPSGYGVFFDLPSCPSPCRSFTLFADLDSTGTFNTSAERVEDILLVNDVEIAAQSVVPLTVFFQPPQPATVLPGGAASATLTLRLASEPTVQKIITIRRSGEIRID